MSFTFQIFIYVLVYTNNHFYHFRLVLPILGCIVCQKFEFELHLQFGKMNLVYT